MIVSFLTTYIFIINYYRYEVKILARQRFFAFSDTSKEHTATAATRKPKDIRTIAKWAVKEGNSSFPVPVIYDELRCRHVINRIIAEA